MKNSKITPRSKYLALFAATALLLINFWAWSLLSPLALQYAAQLSLSPFDLSLLVAAPVVLGSLGRIPVGLLSDRFGGRKLFVAVSWLAAVAVGLLAISHSQSELLAAAVALGVAGASFAAGVPFVNGWFGKRERGLALGIYAMGNAGTAVSGLLTPRLAHLLGREETYWLMAALLVVAGLCMAIFIRESPSWKPARGGSGSRLASAFRWNLTWRLSLLYAITFGAFVALGLYLPILLNRSYGLEMSDAAARAAGFVLVATLARPVGGWLSDRLSGLVVLRGTFLVLSILAAGAALQPSLMPVGTIVYLSLAATLGIGNGALFAVIGHRCDAKIAGTVTGVVGAAGALGGYFPPLIMGLSFELSGSYAAALLLLAAVSFLIFASLRRLFGYAKDY